MSAAIDAAARIGWYLKRARRTLPGEHAWRISDAAARRRWERRAPNVHVAVRPDRPPFAPLGAVEIPSAAEAALAATAAEIRGGRWTVLGWDRSDLARPDWDADGAPEPLPMPLQNILVSEAHQRMSLGSDPSAVAMPVGQIVGRMNEIRPVADIVAELVSGFEAATGRLDTIRDR